MRLDTIQLYTIAWIAMLPTERSAAQAVLDEIHDGPRDFRQHVSDKNIYIWGRVSGHNVVVASPCTAIAGNSSIVAVASSIAASLSHIRFGLSVGLGGGVARPFHGQDIRLGDVVVSQPDAVSSGLVQYDLPRPKWYYELTNACSINDPPPILMKALSVLRSHHATKPPSTPAFVQRIQEKEPSKAFEYPGAEKDNLFLATYSHVAAKAKGNDCSECDSSQRIRRDARTSTDTKTHYGIIATGERKIMESASREDVCEAFDNKIMCIENEAAGLMNRFRCLAIRGICDYADSHGNLQWHNYASATAAAFAAELLGFVPAEHAE